MKSYAWWRTRKARVRKKYELLLSSYLSPKEAKDFARKLLRARKNRK